MTWEDVYAYRTTRRTEKTRRGKAPSSAQLDREVALLKRMGSFAVEDAKMIEASPLRELPMINEPNVREHVLDDAAFERLLQAAEPALKPLILVAYETGIRIGVVKQLKWSQIDLQRRTVHLSSSQTKTKQSRTIVLSERVAHAIAELPRPLHSHFVFLNRRTQRPWVNIRKMWLRACKKAGLEGLWIHDLRRSFVTNARRSGVPESVIMAMTGHRTRSVFFSVQHYF